MIKVKCAFCGNPETKVVDKRDVENSIRRRRECLKCKKRFTTYENAASLNLNVIKKDGRKESYNREKLKGGLLKAFEKRPITMEKIDDFVDEIEIYLRKLKTNEIESRVIGEKIIRELKKLDDVAYLRFASVYKEFGGVDDFRKEIKGVR